MRWRSSRTQTKPRRGFERSVMTISNPENKCPKCGLPFHTGVHVCIHRVIERDPPELHIVEDSEISAQVDLASRGLDNVFRPVIVQQDDGNIIALTMQDAERMYHFLEDAIIFLDGKVWNEQ